jgi:pimeloyl-ACP methyl ester carboxylesterase
VSKITLAEWKKKGKEFKYHNHPIFYHDEGQGEVLLCLHGFPTASWDWHRVWTQLSQRFRVIAPDMIGFGYSAKPFNYNYSILDQATLHEELLQSLDVPSVHILAHNYGDTVTQELLARHRERQQRATPGLAIKSACLLNGGLFPETHRPRLVQRLLMVPLLGPLIGRMLTENRFGHSFSAIFGPDTQPSREELSQFWSLIVFNDGRRVAHKIIRYIEERERHRDRWVGALQETAVPLRFINGPLDPVSGNHMVARYRQLIPNPDVVILDKIGHYPQVEAPLRVLDAFFSFVDSLPEPRE